MNSHEKVNLIQMLSNAHYAAALNNPNNISMAVAKTAYVGSKSYLQSMAAAILSMGKTHAPIKEARKLLQRLQFSTTEDFDLHILRLIQNRKMIPGFGHSYYKDCIDPSFHPVYMEYAKLAPSHNLVYKMDLHIRRACQACDRKISLPPNAAIITAAIAELVDLPPGQDIALTVSARIPAWIEGMNSTIIPK